MLYKFQEDDFVFCSINRTGNTTTLFAKGIHEPINELLRLKTHSNEYKNTNSNEQMHELCSASIVRFKYLRICSNFIIANLTGDSSANTHKYMLEFS